jgi:molybdopterin molybdotransferase
MGEGIASADAATMISFDDAVNRLRAAATPLGHEQVALDAAHGRILAAPVIAAIAAPRHAVSMMDGYAVRADDAARAAVVLRVVGETWPGQPPGADLGPGETRRVLTGGAVPGNAARVIRQEQAVVDGARVKLIIDADGDRFIRAAASDFACGDTLLPAGTTLTPGALIAAAGADSATLTVWRQPRVIIIATGDELVAPGLAATHAHSIPDSASLGIAALAALWGAVVVRRLCVGDDLTLLSAAADDALRDADVVITIGGASVGPRDFARRMFAAHAPDALFEKVAMRPGRPVWVARTPSDDARRYIVGLPGNPGSALVTARLLLAPLLCALGGRPFDQALDWQALTLASDLSANGPREGFERALLRDNALIILDNQSSGAQAPLGQATHLIRRPAHAIACPAGCSVSAIRLY